MREQVPVTESVSVTRYECEECAKLVEEVRRLEAIVAGQAKTMEEVFDRLAELQKPSVEA